MTKNNQTAIAVTNIHKDFILPQSKNSTIKQSFVNIVKKNKKVTQKVLNGINLDIKKGEFFGIVGRNGSGKSTLLKLLAGVYYPTSGSIKINGVLTPFIELGVGFNPELSGCDNVYLNGALLGFTRKQIDEMYDEIVEFAELAPFMGQKLKNYSSGMQVRLAFSIAIKAQTDILLLDEVLAVGDEAFQKKCYSYFASLKKEKKTVILVTHSMDIVQQFCSRAMLIENGQIVDIGEPARISQKYKELFIDDNKKGKKDGHIVENSDIKVESSVKKINNKYIFDVIVSPSINIDDAAVVFFINRSNGERIYRWASDLNSNNYVRLSNKFKLHIEIEDILPVDVFYTSMSIVSKDRVNEYAVFGNLIEFEKSLESTDNQWDIFWKPKTECTFNNL